MRAFLTFHLHPTGRPLRKLTVVPGRLAPLLSLIRRRTRSIRPELGLLEQIHTADRRDWGQVPSQ